MRNFLKIISSKKGAVIKAGIALIRNSKFSSALVFATWKAKLFGVVNLLYISKKGY